ncbi:MAG TPA: hypothetical protein H9830_06220 [Candidatus Agrococcus pullicola]|uniref:Uncharacterized protein n=1 Tax=Candidatus Agrococcus pullicola TaxID=2838429 RepID=A0A9D1YUA2_9MICO|nr:hypothetical protein [Candidatus Agrococcus pullicola]
MSLHERYRRLLRWYPREWRQRNERIVLDTFAERAEDLGLHRPLLGDVVSIASHGLAARASFRTACTIAATAIVLLALPHLLAPLWPEPMPAILEHILLGVAVPLVVLAAVVTTLSHGFITAGRACTVLLIGIAFSLLLRVTASFIVATDQQWLFSLIDESGIQSSLLLTAGGWMLGSTLVGCLLVPAFSAKLGRTAGTAFGVALSIIAGTVFPYLTRGRPLAIAALIVFLVAVLSAPALAQTHKSERERPRRTPSVVIFVSACLICAGVAIAPFLGLGSPENPDGGPAMEVAMTICSAIMAGVVGRVLLLDGHRAGAAGLAILILICGIHLGVTLFAEPTAPGLLDTATVVLVSIGMALAAIAVFARFGWPLPIWMVAPLALAAFSIGASGVIAQGLPSTAFIWSVIFLQYLRPEWQLGRGPVPGGAVPNPLAAERAS